MRVLGRTIAGVCLAVAAIGTAASAPFVPNICVQLESQLVSIERGGGNPTAAAYREYDEALNKQKAELDRARFDASRMGCQPAFSFFGQTSTRDPRCTAVQDTVDKMQANYDRLRARRDQFNFDPYSVQRDRNQVLRSLADNNCGPQYATYRTSGFASLFGGGWNNSRWGDPSQSGDDTLSGTNTYRTLCVRTCDGYYFPISFSTVSGKFQSDQQACQAMCPAADVSLYVHRNPGEDSEAMVSATTGQPYSRLPTAFAYRNSYNPSCTCGTPAATAGAAPATGSATTRPTSLPVPPAPVSKPKGGSEDPESLANLAGDFTLGRLPPKPVTVAGVSPDSAGPSEDREVRTVGPSYFYAR